MKKLMAILAAASMAVSMTVPAMAEGELLIAPNPNAAAEEKVELVTPPAGNPEASFYVTLEAIEPQELGSGEVKWSEEKTADGWMLVKNEGGATLGYHPASGIKLIQVDGFAFKDLDKDGKLDGYEDWRNDAETRAADLASQLSGPEMGPLTCHGGWATFGRTYNHEDPYVLGGGRGGVTRSSHGNGQTETAVLWTNSLQELCESLPWGIPAAVSVDPSEVSGMINNLSLGSTMNVELAHEIGKAISKQWRAVGISMYLGPQVDLMGPTMDRASGTMGEDPRLTRDLTQALVDGIQSTYDEEGNDLGWGKDSVYCLTKHFGGAGASEGGRNDHRNPGRYSVFPGGNFEAHLISYFDGAFNLPGKTESAGAMMQYAINVVDGESFGGEFSSAYNEGMTRLLQDNWDGFSITDWGIISGPMADWGVENMTTAERIVRLWVLGTDHLGLQSNMDEIAEAYDLLVELYGQEEADNILRASVYQFFRIEMKLGLFENPYLNKEYSVATIWSEDANAYGEYTRDQAVIMLKNDGTVKKAEEGAEKKTVYVPAVYTAASRRSPASVNAAMDVEVLSKYFNVITDTAGEPSGKDDDGKAVLTADDIVRASAEDIAKADFILVPMTAPYTGSAVSTDEEGKDTWTPASLQYAEYTADTAREVSLGGKILEDGTKENRSYKGQTAKQSSAYKSLELLQYCASVAGDKPVVVYMNAGRGMVWTEVEPLADVILLSFGNRADQVARILAGTLEPTALLPMQQPASMEAVEAQLEDVPRDMECYVDAAGNVYDFAFGLNWSGVIDDERTATYKQEPITKVETVKLFEEEAEETAETPAAEAPAEKPAE